MKHAFPTFQRWLASATEIVTVKKFQRGPAWKCSTIWPSDTREAVEQSLVRILAVAHRERLDAARLVALLAREHRALDRGRMERLAKRLSGGIPLASALEQTRDVLSDDKVLAIRFGSQSGTLATTFRELLDQSQMASQRAKILFQQWLVYCLVVVAVMLLLIAFQVAFILPTFRQLIEEFGVARQPALWSWRLLNFTVEILRAFTVWISLFGSVLLVALTLPWTRMIVRRNILPLLVRPIAKLRSAQLMRMLSVAEDEGRPIPGSLSTLAHYHFDRSVRMKLLVARNEVEQGAEIWSALSNARLITERESRALANSKCRSTRAWLLRRLATWKADGVERRAITTLALVQPTVILILGAIVLCVAWASIGFISHIISSLA